MIFLAKDRSVLAMERMVPSSVSSFPEKSATISSMVSSLESVTSCSAYTARFARIAPSPNTAITGTVGTTR